MLAKVNAQPSTKPPLPAGTPKAQEGDGPPEIPEDILSWLLELDVIKDIPGGFPESPTLDDLRDGYFIGHILVNLLKCDTDGDEFEQVRPRDIETDADAAEEKISDNFDRICDGLGASMTNAEKDILVCDDHAAMYAGLISLLRKLKNLPPVDVQQPRRLSMKGPRASHMVRHEDMYGEGVDGNVALTENPLGQAKTQVQFTDQEKREADNGEAFETASRSGAKSSSVTSEGEHHKPIKRLCTACQTGDVKDCKKIFEDQSTNADGTPRGLKSSRKELNTYDEDDDNNQYPIHIAARYGHVEVIRWLLSERADSRVSTISGAQPLYIAAQEGHLDCVKMLLNPPDFKPPLKIKVDINAKVFRGNTPLMAASCSGHPDVVKYLIDNKADLNLCSVNQETAVMMAASKNRVECLRLLIEAKAELNLRDVDGYDALYIAWDLNEAGSYEVIIDMLISAGVENNGRPHYPIAADFKSKQSKGIDTDVDEMKIQVG